MKTLLQILLLFIFSACGSSKWTETRVSENSFYEVIPVEMQIDLMFTNVVIEGKTYRFLIDTGAPFCISPEIAKTIGFKPKGSAMTSSSGLKKGKLNYGVVKQAQLGNLTFKNLTTFVIDFEKSIILDCLDFDGIVGANLMNTAVWQLDPQQKQVIITDDVAKLELDGAYTLPMRKSSGQNSPYIPIQINDAEEGYVIFDSGSGHFMTITYNSYLKAKEKGIESDIEIIEGRGLGSSGIFGADDTTQFEIKLPKVKVGEELLTNVVTDMSHTNKAKIGMKFVKGRVVTLDFPNKKFYIKPTPKANIPQEFDSYGFSIWPTLEGDFFIGMLYNESPAVKAGLQVRDKIETINGKIISGESADVCNLYFELRELLSDTDSISIKVENRPKITLKKKVLLD